MKRKILDYLLAGPLVVFCFAIIISGVASAELFFSGYMGIASTHDTDVELNRPGGTNLTFSDVSWDDDSFASPIYYGLRAGYWFKNSPNWGMAVDFTHAKMYAELDKSVHVSGNRNGSPVSGQERLRDTFDVLEFSDGHNLLTLNGMYRLMSMGASKNDFLNRLQPYVLAGLGIAMPHVEVTVDGDRTFEYQATGLAAQTGAGLDVEITRWLSVFAEYRLSYAGIDANLEGGGTLETEPWTHHVNLGVTFSWLQ